LYTTSIYNWTVQQ